MHDLFLESDTESVIDGNSGKGLSHYQFDEVPERDITNRNISKEKTSRQTFDSLKDEVSKPSVAIKAPFPSDKNHKPVSKSAPKDSENSQESPMAPNVNISHKTTMANDMESERIQDLEKEIRSLKEDILKEKVLRVEVEESAKHVYIQLQKVENELQREREMKESLLMESHHFKVAMEESQAKISRIKSDYNGSKIELQQLESKVQTLSTEKANIVQRLLYLCHDLGLNQDHVKCGLLHDCATFFDFLKAQFQQLKKMANRDDSVDQIRKLTSQLNSLVGRCATLEKERDTVKNELTECHSREDHLKNQLHMCQMNITTSESELLKKQIEYECIVQKLRSECELEKDKFSSKLAEYSSVIKKSKELLLNLRNERDHSHKRLKELLNSKNSLEMQVQTLTAERQNLIYETERTKNKISDMAQEKFKNVEQLQIEKMNLELSLRKCVSERKKCMELLGEMKHQLLNLRNKCEHDAALFNMEREKLVHENRRLDENLRVLSKVSEDQGKTITKLRGDIEDLKGFNFKLDSEIRDHESTENQLIKKLDQSEKQSERYVQHIDELEEKILRYAEELRNHDCADFVDSKYKIKAEEIETTLQEQMREWQLSLNEIKNEKDEAVSCSRNTLEKMEEMKRAHESVISDIKTKFQAEVNRSNELRRKQDEATATKIRELQSELDRIKNSSSQIQRALSTKIKQLQAALSICLGGSNPQQNKNSMYDFGSQIHHHHNNHSGFSGSSGSAGGIHNGSNSCCVNSNAANLLNVDGGQTESHTCFTFGNPIINDCTSGTFSTETCTTTGVFGLDVFGSLL